MGAREARYAARVADMIKRRGSTFTLKDGEKVRAIADTDYASITKKVGIEAVEEVREKGGRTQLLYISPADESRIPKGTSLTDEKGVRWSCEPGRELSPDDTDMMVALFCMAGIQE